MNLQEELKRMKSALFNRISSAASSQDLAGVSALGGLIRECEALEADLASLSQRIEEAKSALNGSSSLPSSITSGKLIKPAEVLAPSRKIAGAQARNEWVSGLQVHSISLNGRGKRFQSPRGQSVAVAFANELCDHENRWFLGLSDEPTEVAVLLCKSLAGKLHDIVLPVSRLREAWRALSRHRREVKFNVKFDAGRFWLLVPGNEPLEVTMYIGNYDPLR